MERALKNTLRPCPTCRRQQGEVLHHQDFEASDGHPLSGGYDVIACSFCGFVFADTNVSQAQYDEYYEKMSKYADKATGTGGGLSGFDAERLQATAQAIAGVLSREDRILDIGCANGGLLVCLRDLGFPNVAGVDPSAGCVRVTKSRGIEAFEGFLGSLPFEPASFDCIIVSHVLEHVQNLDEAMKSILSLLEPNGLLYIEVPDAARYVDCLYAPFQDFNTEHINHFSGETLRTFARQFRLEPVREGAKTIRSSETSLYPAIFGMFRRGGAAHGPIERRASLDETIGRYVSLSQRMMTELGSRLEGRCDEAAGVIVWGMGQLAMKLFHCPALQKAMVVAYVDSNPVNQGKSFHGTPIVGPAEIGGLSQPILISSLLHQVSIERQIRSMGFQNLIITLRDHPEVPFGVPEPAQPANQ